jgi:hypothetical protein
MAVDWHKRSGKSHLDGISRSLARRGLDLLDITGVTAVGEYKHSSRSVIDGVIRNRVEEGLGSDKYKKICRKRTVLENIHYCQSGLSFVDGFHNPHKVVPVPGVSTLGDAVAAPSFINHDYLVLEVGYGQGGDKIFIRAEKSGHPSEKAGIILTVDPKFEETEESVRLFTIPCLGKEIGLPEILAILADHSPEYSLRDQNCWQYTRRTARRLLHQCKQQQGLSDEEIERLEVEEDTLETRIATGNLKRVVQSGKNGVKHMWSKAFG